MNCAKVVSRGQSTGPQGVQLVLKKAGGDDQTVKQTFTSLGGDFVFEKVLPGDFVIEASRSPWIFDVVRCVAFGIIIAKEIIYFNSFYLSWLQTLSKYLYHKRFSQLVVAPSL